jgi:hypothetical protein
MVAANPFERMVTENPYRHIRHFTTLRNTVRQEGVPDEWFKSVADTGFSNWVYMMS